MPRGSYRRAKSTRRKYWLGLNSATAGTNVNAGARTDITLMSLADAHDTTTLLRIVGSVHTSLQAGPALVAPVHWGIYKVSGLGSVAELILNPNNSIDIGDDSWLHWRAVNHFLADDQTEYRDDMVDIKVKRKIDGGQSLKLSMISTVAYHHCINLRGLFLAT